MTVSLLTHNDLDALGCYLALSQKFNFEKIYSTNYANFNTVYSLIKDCPSENLIIADVSMSTFKNELLELSNKFKNIILIDHHLYPDDYFYNIPDNIKVVHNVKQCACKNCYDLLKIDNIKLLKLLNLINIFDIWLSDNSDFFDALIFNDFFWKSCQKMNFVKLADKIREMQYNYEYIIEKAKPKYIQKYTDIINDFKKRGIIQRYGNITIILNDDFFNNVVYDEIKDGQKFIICFKYNYVKIRISPDACSDDHKIYLRKTLCNGNIVGHLDAFSYKMGGATPEDIINEAKHIIEIINKNVE